MRVPRPPAKMTTFMTTNIYKGSKTYVIERLINVKSENVLTWYPLLLYKSLYYAVVETD